LVFEGIAYQGEVFLNKTSVGESMQPYSRYIYDVTSLIVDGINELVVELADLPAVFGPSEGWENSSGIVRDVYIEYVPFEYIKDIFFHQNLNEKLTKSDITVEINASGGDSARIRLGYDGREVLDAVSDPESMKVTTEFLYPSLWSPENPALYDLTVELIKSGEVIDTLTEKVGFKDFTIDGNRFLLNGKPCFLKGVCRHDMWGEQGFTLSDEQIETDLQMIKAMGVNFIRLVHYPHDVRVVEAADRIGLLVSEEPGLWWSDMQNPGVTSGALEVLKRTIIRDRSRVSLAFWLAFNECIFTEEFLKDTEELVRALDPYRAVSGANCMNLKMTKDLFSKYNWDFYTFHPYGPLPSMVTAGYGAEESYATLDEVISHLSDKPLVFTEWGGWWAHDNPALYKMFVKTFASNACEREDGLQLAGMCYWVWNDMYETNRGLPACVDGILVEGLVDIHRNKRVNYYTQAECFHEFDKLAPSYPGEVEITGLDVKAGKQTVIDIYAGVDQAVNDEAFIKALDDAKANSGFFQHKKTRKLEIGPVLPYEIRGLGSLRVKLPASRPLVAGTNKIDVSVETVGHTLCLIGMTTLSDAFPIAGKAGDVLAKLIINYDDGSKQERDLINGKELCTTFMTYGSSRIDPRAGETNRVITLKYDKNWERYCINTLCVPVDSGKKVKSVEITAVSPAYPVMLYGITILSD